MMMMMMMMMMMRGVGGLFQCGIGMWIVSVWDRSVDGLFLCGIEGVGRMVMCSVE